MEMFVVELVQKYPMLATVFLVMGGLRAIIKPLMAYLEQRAAETHDKADDERLERVKASRWYKAMAFILDYGGSIKLPR